MSETKLYVIDRFEDGLAVLNSRESSDEIIVSRDKLPDVCKEGDYLRIQVNDGTIISATIDTEGTAQARERIKKRLERLRRGEHLKNNKRKG